MILESSSTTTSITNDGVVSTHSCTVPTNSFSTQSFSCGDFLKNSIAGAAALVTFGLPTIAFETPTNRIFESSRFSQTVRNDFQAKFSNYVFENEHAVHEFIDSRPETTVFLENIASIIVKHFGLVKISLDSWTSHEDHLTKLYLTIQSGIENEELLMDTEIALFSEIESNLLLKEGLSHAVIAIR